jgi:hypothetical protein
LSAFAADNNAQEFYAVSELNPATNLQVMSDSQLTAVEGMSYTRHNGGYSSSWTSIYQSNSLSQANLNFGGKRGGDVYQGNYAFQSNNAIVR